MSLTTLDVDAEYSEGFNITQFPAANDQTNGISAN